MLHSAISVVSDETAVLQEARGVGETRYTGTFVTSSSQQKKEKGRKEVETHCNSEQKHRGARPGNHRLSWSRDLLSASRSSRLLSPPFQPPLPSSTQPSPGQVFRRREAVGWRHTDALVRRGENPYWSAKRIILVSERKHLAWLSGEAFDENYSYATWPSYTQVNYWEALSPVRFPSRYRQIRNAFTIFLPVEGKIREKQTRIQQERGERDLGKQTRVQFEKRGKRDLEKQTITQPGRSRRDLEKRWGLERKRYSFIQFRRYMTVQKCVVRSDCTM